ncbi:MAG: hypothetical protein D5R98_10200 [Desulfonatronovibrio sp. MSAO_Bac4]|nr:MAG: hypothetical protein D5R98_10200 [Desulfonatronovibrio sp. MSAO_Bac4]
MCRLTPPKGKRAVSGWKLFKTGWIIKGPEVKCFRPFLMCNKVTNGQVVFAMSKCLKAGEYFI